MTIIVHDQRRKLKKAIRKHQYLEPLLYGALYVSTGLAQEIILPALIECKIDYEIKWGKDESFRN